VFGDCEYEIDQRKELLDPGSFPKNSGALWRFSFFRAGMTTKGLDKVDFLISINTNHHPTKTYNQIFLIFNF
jgi:hypothetical protein